MLLTDAPATSAPPSPHTEPGRTRARWGQDVCPSTFPSPTTGTREGTGDPRTMLQHPGQSWAGSASRAEIRSPSLPLRNLELMFCSQKGPHSLTGQFLVLEHPVSSRETSFYRSGKVPTEAWRQGTAAHFPSPPKLLAPYGSSNTTVPFHTAASPGPGSQQQPHRCLPFWGSQMCTQSLCPQVLGPGTGTNHPGPIGYPAFPSGPQPYYTESSPAFPSQSL